MENLNGYLDLVFFYLFNVVVALLIFVVGRWLAARISGTLADAMGRRKLEPTLVNFLSQLLYYALLAAVAIAALNRLGVQTASLLAVFGAAGLAVALALKDSLGNFSAGVMLILFKPFRVGDFVTAGGVSGSVKEISIFHTELATPDNQKIIVPNSAIMGGVIINVTANPTRRLDLVFGVSYGDDLARSKEIIRAALAAESRILPEPAPVIAVAELADSSVNIVARPWVKTSEYWDIRFALIEQIKQDFDRAGIVIPFPQRDVHMHVVEKQAA